MRRAKCERCTFRAPVGADYRCDYCAITGQTRLAAPPEQCRHFRAGARIERTQEKKAAFVEATPRPKVRHGGGPRPKYDWGYGRALYDQGKNDVEISRELGCDPNTVHRWRRKLGLPANAGPGGKSARREAGR
jgi:hypothetical protein